jgi:diadenosine tetraphosphate (Ap4A) HIT family hydrolase
VAIIINKFNGWVICFSIVTAIYEIIDHMKYSELLKNIDTCPFCNLSNHEILIEKENAFLTYAIAPYHPDHLLVCPKRHIEHILDLTQEESRDIDALQKEGLRVLNNMKYTNVSFLVREGDNIGKSVKHLHYHLIPDIALGAGEHCGGDRMVLSKEEVAELLLRLRSAL